MKTDNTCVQHVNEGFAQAGPKNNHYNQFVVALGVEVHVMIVAAKCSPYSIPCANLKTVMFLWTVNVLLALLCFIISAVTGWLGQQEILSLSTCMINRIALVIYCHRSLHPTLR